MLPMLIPYYNKLLTIYISIYIISQCEQNRCFIHKSVLSYIIYMNRIFLRILIAKVKKTFTKHLNILYYLHYGIKGIYNNTLCLTKWVRILEALVTRLVLRVSIFSGNRLSTGLPLHLLICSQLHKKYTRLCGYWLLNII